MIFLVNRIISVYHDTNNGKDDDYKDTYLEMQLINDAKYV